MAENPDLEGKLYEAVDLLGASATSLPLGDAASTGTLSAEAAVEFSAGLAVGSASAISEARQIPASGFATPSPGEQPVADLGLTVSVPAYGEAEATQSISSPQARLDGQITVPSAQNPAEQAEPQPTSESVFAAQPFAPQPFAASAPGATDVADEGPVTPVDPVAIDTVVGGVEFAAPDAAQNLPGSKESSPGTEFASGSAGTNGADGATDDAFIQESSSIGNSDAISGDALTNAGNGGSAGSGNASGSSGVDDTTGGSGGNPSDSSDGSIEGDPPTSPLPDEDVTVDLGLTEPLIGETLVEADVTLDPVENLLGTDIDVPVVAELDASAVLPSPPSGADEDVTVDLGLTEPLTGGTLVGADVTLDPVENLLGTDIDVPVVAELDAGAVLPSPPSGADEDVTVDLGLTEPLTGETLVEADVTLDPVENLLGTDIDVALVSDLEASALLEGDVFDALADLASASVTVGDISVSAETATTSDIAGANLTETTTDLLSPGLLDTTEPLLLASESLGTDLPLSTDTAPLEATLSGSATVEVSADPFGGSILDSILDASITIVDTAVTSSSELLQTSTQDLSSSLQTTTIQATVTPTSTVVSSTFGTIKSLFG
ncbi:MAG: hypothetical protein ACO1OX_00575 [Novosphingobium sp.]